MSILNVNKINPVGGGSTITIAGIASVTSSVTAPSFVGNLTGTATGLNGTPNISVGTINASSATITGGMISAQNSGAGSGSSQIQLQPYGTDAYINCTASNNLYTRMGAGFTIRTRIDGSGNFTVNSGNLIIGTAGKGIDYSAQTPTAVGGATATGEVLSHYEEGTWTPFFINVNTPTFNSTPTGRYTRIGRFVYLTGVLDVASGLDTSDGSAVGIGGLPFVGNNDHNSCLFSFGRYTNLMSDSRLATVTNFRFNGNSVMLHRGNNTDINYTLMNSSGKLEFAMSYSQ